MAYFRFGFLFFVVSLLAACDPVADRAYRTEGPGVQLASDSTTTRTADLKTYFNQLCDQADLVDSAKPGVCDADLQERDWRVLVFTGFNDIDARCDAYLNWLDQKRAERLFVDEGSIAVGALVGGVLGLAAPGTDALNYLALAFGFTQSIYSSYHDSILLGVEPSTVKAIVYKRRSEFRKAVRNRIFEFKPDAVYALRSYLRICMPQTIVMNVNEYSREAILGGDPVGNDTDEAVNGFSRPIGPDDLVNGRPPRQAPVTGTEAAKLFTTEVSGAPDTLVPTIQRRLCLQKYANGAYDHTASGPASGADGVVGSQTYAGVFVAEAYLKRFGRDKASVVRDNRINNAELDILSSGRNPNCGGGDFRNYYENIRFARGGDNPTSAEENYVDFLFQAYEALRGGRPARSVPANKSFGDPAVRETIGALRDIAGAELTVDTAAPDAFKPYFKDALTLDLSEYLDRKSEGN